MKKLKLVAALSALVAPAIMAGTISGSAHDFQGKGWSGGQICIACHAPHGTNTTVTDAPLWNHALATTTYTLYTSPTMNATIGQPGATSKLCLSCHDGTVAIDSFGSVVGTSMMTGSKNLGTSLANDHPIGITYDAGLVASDGSLAPLTTPVTIGSGTKTKTGTIATTLLVGGKVECASCHDVHNTFTAGGDLVKMSLTASALCAACHTK
jgi:predicted CXXCH cytochrome family protein